MLSLLSCALVLAAVAAPAEAQSRPFERGLRIGLATDLVARGEQTTSVSSSFSGTSETTVGTTSYGLGMPRLGVDLGGFPIPWLGIGLVLSVGQTEQSSPTSGGSISERDVLEYAVLPYAEARIPLMDVLSLQFRLNIGVVGTETSERSSFSSSAFSMDTTQFAIGAQAGLHVFPAESFSISPYFGFRYTTGDGNAQSGSSSSITPFGLEGWQITLGVALLGWIDLTGGGPDDELEPVEEMPLRQPQPISATVAPAYAAPAAAATPATPPAPSAEPVVAGDVMATELVIPGATGARVLGNLSTGDARIELRTTGAQARFGTCTEALLVSSLGSAVVAARAQVTQTLTGIDEAVYVTGRPEQLDALRGEGSRIELCGVRIDIDANNRYRIGRLLAALRIASPAAHGPGPGAQPAPGATGLTAPQ